MACECCGRALRARDGGTVPVWRVVRKNFPKKVEFFPKEVLEAESEGNRKALDCRQRKGGRKGVGARRRKSRARGPGPQGVRGQIGLEGGLGRPHARSFTTTQRVWAPESNQKPQEGFTKEWSTTLVGF